MTGNSVNPDDTNPTRPLRKSPRDRPGTSTDSRYAHEADAQGNNSDTDFDTNFDTDSDTDAETGRPPGLLGDTVLAHPLLRAVVVALATFGLWALFGAIAAAVTTSTGAGRIAVPLAQAAGALLGYVVVTWLIEGRWPSELAPWPGLPELVIGTAAGAVLVLLAMTALWLGDVIELGPGDGYRHLPVVLLAGLGWITLHELLLRGVVVRLLERYLGTFLAVLATALGFAVAFAFQPRVTPLAVLSVALWGGVMLTAAFMRTRRVWLPLGMRLGWYTMLTGVFGVAFWSTRPNESLLRLTDRGPEWLSGGPTGPGGSVLLGGAALCVGFLMLAGARERGLLGSARTWKRRDQQPRWRRQERDQVPERP